MGFFEIYKSSSKIAKNDAKCMGLGKIMENHENRRNNENNSEKLGFSRFPPDFFPILARFSENSDDFSKF